MWMTTTMPLTMWRPMAMVWNQKVNPGVWWQEHVVVGVLQPTLVSLQRISWSGYWFVTVQWQRENDEASGMHPGEDDSGRGQQRRGDVQQPGGGENPVGRSCKCSKWYPTRWTSLKCNHCLWQTECCSEGCAMFHKGSWVRNSKAAQWKFHQETLELKLGRFGWTNSVVSSGKKGDNWLKHQMSRRGVKHTPVNSLVLTDMYRGAWPLHKNDTQARLPILWLKCKQVKGRDCWC